MEKIIQLQCAFLFLILIFAVSGCSKFETYIPVAGQIYLEAEDTHQDVTVRLVTQSVANSSEYYAPEYSLITDDAGDFQIFVPAGKFECTINKEGYEGYSFDLDTTTGKAEYYLGTFRVQRSSAPPAPVFRAKSKINIKE